MTDKSTPLAASLQEGPQQDVMRPDGGYSIGRGEGLKLNSQLKWGRYPIRVCRSLHHCTICERDISSGERYYDGGLMRRGHAVCVEEDKFNEQR